MLNVRTRSLVTSTFVTAISAHAQHISVQFTRNISEEQLSASSDHVADLLSQQVKGSPKTSASSHIRTTRREALSLYREILRYSNLFVWRDDKGRVWRDVIRHSARQEFDDARFERDPELVNKLIITGRDAVQRSVDAFMQKRKKMQEQEDFAAGAGPLK